MRRSSVGKGLARIAAALAIGVLGARGPIQKLDRRLYRFVNRPRGARADAVAKGITELGSLWASGAASAALARAGRKRAAVDAMGAALAMWAVGQILKKVTDRPRPYQALEDSRLLIAEPSGTSWPSSHPAVLLTFVTVAARDLGACPASRAGLSALAGLVGMSRMYLGVHYPSDVAGGLLLGRGVADLWSTLVSSRVVPHPSADAPLQ
ncbi:MAG: phosphatase PAP2 family protein [Actinobacteria bacterium]|nr:MAG: phosphatase PAP2 family protein [Actinomycetota bacterium]